MADYRCHKAQLARFRVGLLAESAVLANRAVRMVGAAAGHLTHLATLEGAEWAADCSQAVSEEVVEAFGPEQAAMAGLAAAARDPQTTPVAMGDLAVGLQAAPTAPDRQASEAATLGQAYFQGEVAD